MKNMAKQRNTLISCKKLVRVTKEKQANNLKRPRQTKLADNIWGKWTHTYMYIEGNVPAYYFIACGNTCT